MAATGTRKRGTKAAKNGRDGDGMGSEERPYTAATGTRKKGKKGGQGRLQRGHEKRGQRRPRMAATGTLRDGIREVLEIEAGVEGELAGGVEG